ncbi:DUF4129 domain-containing protein [Mangrovimonas spongiae]|uniref:DUF4129 domain-containing protein n=1 Tax=Mangrovimonas spongiae TaxID=2494697 RepID=UPI001F0CBD6D|nr:DUF4129 domain-containing protein [Mangrovimonas spongiae]
MIKFLLVFLFCTTLAFGQTDSLNIVYDNTKVEVRDITEKNLEQYKDNPDFNYTEKSESTSVIAKFFRWLKNIVYKIFEYLFGVEKATGILSFILKALPYALLGLLVFLLVKLFLRYNQKHAHTPQKLGNITISDEEHIIKNEDIEALITNALKEQNFRLAIRYYYLLSLKYLTEKKLIDWQQQKTNTDYISELESEDLKHNFEQATHVYDYVWYGEFQVENTKFESLKTIFETLNNSIKAI